MQKIKPNSKPIEFWQTAFIWLKACGIKVNSNFCKEEISTHPDYPALISVIDFLDSGNMAYQAVQADASFIHEFNYPLLAHIRQPGQEYMAIINDKDEWDKQHDITQYWSGIVVCPEKNAKWQNEQNNIYQKNAQKNTIIIAGLVLAGLAIFIASVFKLPDFPINVFGLLSFLGLSVSLFTLGSELGIQTQLVKQVCGAVSEGGCEQVLKSRYAKGIAGITPADAAVLYFSSQLIIYLLGCWYQPILQSIFLFAFGGIIIAAWSIYTQQVKLKQWCALCLGIVTVLILQSLIAFIVRFPLQEISPGIVFVGLFLFLALLLLPIKQLIKTNKSNKLKLSELKKWKLDAGLFITQWQQEPKVDASVWKNDLLLGNPSASLLITVACNPYCGPCAKAHKQLDKLLHHFDDKIKLQIRLLCDPENADDTRTIAVKAILQRASVMHDATEMQQMMTDWFEWMNFEKWKTKWQPDTNIKVTDVLLQHSVWSKQSNIAFTPTFFVNGKKMPGRYSLDDVEILIPQLAELIKTEINANY